MKKFIFSNFKSLVVISFTLLLMSFSTITVAQDNCPPDFGCSKILTRTAVVSVPNFPNCFLKIEYKLRVCFGNFQIYDVNILNLDFNQCEDWLNFMVGIYTSVDGEVAFQSYIRSFNKAIGSQLLDEIAKKIAKQADPTLFYCGTGVAQTLTGAFYPGGCISTCIGVRDGEDIFRQVSCNGDLCCGYKKEYCVDPITLQPVLLSEGVEETGGSCSGINTKQCPEIPGVTWELVSPCFSSCIGKGAKGVQSENLVSAPLQQVNKVLGSGLMSVKLFPNPTHEYLNLFFEAQFIGTVSLLNMTGQLLQVVNVSDVGLIQLNVSSLAKGTYIVSFQDNSGNITTEKVTID